MFDSGKTGSIEKEKVRTILNTLGHTYDDVELSDMLDAEDVEGMNAQHLQEWCQKYLDQSEHTFKRIIC